MEKFIAAKWNMVTKPKVYLNDNRVYVFRFKTEEELREVLDVGPWLFKGTHPLVLKMWTPGTKLDPTSFASLPVWVTFLGFNLQFWSPRMLSRIASMVGKPYYADKLTATKERLGLLRN
eukprot:TRINITY_DN35350_c0_g1_i1.p1 TRINITY_DN35350_c0_g1~~TRINITY_DN35350_c0_g1_i1.p1  ORF type:complete len:135 (-),score=11.02 TRINITY_DN35350_c0_g1_i1:364-720(-)